MTAPASVRSTVLIALDLIDAPLLDARIARDPEKLEELARDILRRGLIEPIKVKRRGDRCEVVDGFRRYLAAKHAGLTEIECFVVDVDGAESEGIKYAANAYREDMSAAEEALLFWQLFKHECGEDIEKVCALVGKKLAYVDSRLQLIAGDELIFDALKDRKIQIGVAQELNTLPAADYRRYYLEHAIVTGATVATVRGWVQEWKAMYGDRPSSASSAVSATSGAVVSGFDPHFCAICRKSDPRFIPEQLSVHTHCKIAILEPLLDSYHGSDNQS